MKNKILNDINDFLTDNKSGLEDSIANKLGINDVDFELSTIKNFDDTEVDVSVRDIINAVIVDVKKAISTFDR